MDHRWASRKEVNMDVMVYRNGLPVTRCKASDISSDGMFIKTGPLSYRRNSCLEVALISADGFDEVKLSATVVYSNDNGMGLMFRFKGSDVITVLKEMFLDNPQPRQAIAAGMVC